MNVHNVSNSLRTSFFVVLSLFLTLSAWSQSTIIQRSYPALTITGPAGTNFPVEYADVLGNPTAWTTLTNVTLAAGPNFLVDSTAPNSARRFYLEGGVTILPKIVPGLEITGTPGSTNMIQYIEPNGDPNTWITLTNLVLPGSPYTFYDTISPVNARRVYRAEDLGRPPAITSASSALVQTGDTLSYQITASSYLAITSYDATGLPAGFSVDSSSGVISGSTAQAGTNILTIIARNSAGQGSASLTLSVRRSLATQMASIPAGTFLTGSPANEPGRDPNEGPQTQVAITHSFSIGKYEVSQAEYLAVVGSNPSTAKGDLSRPVESLTWSQAVNFCALLTTRDRNSGFISANSFYRLPTEAEWEYAARAGTTTAYPSGADDTNLSQYGWYVANSAGTTHSTGQKLPNVWGLYDVSGNTWEFCSDWFGTYPGGFLVDPTGPSNNTEAKRIIRGGSWSGVSTTCRSASRFGLPVAQAHSDVGFRIVLVTQ